MPALPSLEQLAAEAEETIRSQPRPSLPLDTRAGEAVGIVPVPSKTMVTVCDALRRHAGDAAAARYAKFVHDTVEAGRRASGSGAGGSASAGASADGAAAGDSSSAGAREERRSASAGGAVTSAERVGVRADGVRAGGAGATSAGACARAGAGVGRTRGGATALASSAAASASVKAASDILLEVLADGEWRTAAWLGQVISFVTPTPPSPKLRLAMGMLPAGALEVRGGASCGWARRAGMPPPAGGLPQSNRDMRRTQAATLAQSCRAAVKAEVWRRKMSVLDLQAIFSRTAMGVDHYRLNAVNTLPEALRAELLALAEEEWGIVTRTKYHLLGPGRTHMRSARSMRVQILEIDPIKRTFMAFLDHNTRCVVQGVFDQLPPVAQLLLR